MRAPIRYSITGDSWEFGNSFDGCGANAAAVLDDAGNMYGVWKGHNLIQMIPGFGATTVGFNYSTDGGPVHAVDSTRSVDTIYFVRAESFVGGYGRIYSIPADGTAQQGDVVQLVKTPWQVGMGVAIEYVPSELSTSGYGELWVLRGAGFFADDSGEQGFETTDLGIYVVEQDYWVTRLLTNYYSSTRELFFADGSDMCRVDNQMFFLTEPVYYGPAALVATPFVPEPFVCSGLVLAILLLRRKG
jgi:hypothetical protein